MYYFVESIHKNFKLLHCPFYVTRNLFYFIVKKVRLFYCSVIYNHIIFVFDWNIINACILRYQSHRIYEIISINIW